MIHPLLAEMSGLEIGFCVLSGVIGVAGIIIGVIGLVKKQEVVVSPQPVQVQITEELHKQFASKEAFDKHLQDDKEAHDAFAAELKQDRQRNQEHISQRQKTVFDEVKATRTALEEKMTDEHQDNSNRLNRFEKAIGALEATTQIQNQQLARIEAKLDRIK